MPPKRINIAYFLVYCSIIGIIKLLSWLLDAIGHWKVMSPNVLGIYDLPDCLYFASPDLTLLEPSCRIPSGPSPLLPPRKGEKVSFMATCL